MKIPKYINDYFRKRTEYAYEVIEYDKKIFKWLKSKGLDENLFPSPLEFNSILLITEPKHLSHLQRERIKQYNKNEVKQ